MAKHTFKRGIHPPGHKSATADKPIEVILPAVGELMVYPLRQGVGATCASLVTAGDYVRNGQKIGDSEETVSTPVHASVSGTVREIRQTMVLTGTMTNAVVIENDGQYADHPSLLPYEGYMSYPRERLLEIIREAGVIGLGGAGFPTHVKLNPSAGKEIDYIIINAAECEPYLTTDYRVMLEESERIIHGLKIILTMFPGAKGLIAIETDKPGAIAKMKSALADVHGEEHSERIAAPIKSFICLGAASPLSKGVIKTCNASFNRGINIEIVALKPKYPQGSERQLIYACTGREVPSGGLPMDVGCIVNNVDTVIAVERALRLGRPLMRKVVTVAGDAVNSPGNYKVRLGMSYKSLIESTGGYKSTPRKMIYGGPMMGIAMFTDDVPVTKTSSGFLCFTDEYTGLPSESNCIRCAKCVRYCPAGLLPLELNQFSLRREFDSFKKYDGMECIECGACSYICPAKRHLTQSIRGMRRELLKKRNN